MNSNAKISLACDACRHRRRKCDLKRPSCSQCMRAKARCVGYRDPQAIQIRDQTATITLRQRHQEGDKTLSKSRSRDQESQMTSVCKIEAQIRVITASFESDDGDSSSAAPTVPPRSLSIQPEQVALSMFMQQCAASSQFEYLSRYWNFLDRRDERIEVAISVPAMALLAQRTRDASLLQAAYSRYGRLIRDTQNALTNYFKARTDATLIAVISLALFEALVLTTASAETSQRWKTHMIGAASLLQIRGPRQFENELGRRLYIHASNGIRATCVMSATSVPLALSETEQLASVIDPWFRLAIQQGQALQDIATYQSTRLKLPLPERIRACKQLDTEVGVLLEAMRAFDPPQIMRAAQCASLPASELSYLGIVKTYSSRHWSQRFNIFNMFRTFLCSAHNVGLMAMTTELMTDDPDSFLPCAEKPDQWQDGREALKSLHKTATHDAIVAAEDILHSVPFVVSMSDDPMFSARSITGPLFAVAASEAISPKARAYAKARLDHLNRDLELTQGVSAAKMATQGIQANFQAWSAAPFTKRQ